jgi:hypothetical protein
MSEVRYGPFADRLFGRRVSQIVGGLTPAEEVPTTGELAGVCDLVFGHGSSTLAGSAGTLTGTNAAQMVFGHGSSTLTGGGQLYVEPGSSAGIHIVLGHLVIEISASAALAATTALTFSLDGALATGGAIAGQTDMVFGHDAVISADTAFETPIVIMARMPS